MTETGFQRTAISSPAHRISCLFLSLFPPPVTFQNSDLNLLIVLRIMTCILRLLSPAPPESGGPFSFLALFLLCVQVSRNNGLSLHFSKWSHPPVQPGYFCLDCFYSSSLNFPIFLSSLMSHPSTFTLIDTAQGWVFSVLAEAVTERWSVSKSRSCHAPWTSKPPSICHHFQNKSTSCTWPPRPFLGGVLSANLHAACSCFVFLLHGPLEI